MSIVFVVTRGGIPVNFNRMNVLRLVQAVQQGTRGPLRLRPENHHLRLLHVLALRCGPGSRFVEYGTTDNSVTAVLAAAASQLAESKVEFVGDLGARFLRLAREKEWDELVKPLNDEDRSAPAIVFLAEPSLVFQGLSYALKSGARLICVYDIRSARIYKLPALSENAQVATLLAGVTDRTRNVVAYGVSGELTQRGMMISELGKTSVVIADEVQVEEPETVQQPAKFGFFSKTSLASPRPSE